MSEHFVFFNDDMFLIDSVRPEDFFKNGFPCDCCIETALVQDDIRNPFANILMNDAALANMHYNKKEAVSYTHLRLRLNFMLTLSTSMAVLL